MRFEEEKEKKTPFEIYVEEFFLFFFFPPQKRRQGSVKLKI